MSLSHAFRSLLKLLGGLPTWTLVTLAVAACGDSKATTPSPLVVDEQPAETYLVGIRSEDFKCNSLLSTTQSTELFGGRVTPLESPFTPPAGVPKACNYASHGVDRDPIQWSFDLDCREGALGDAGKLFVTYANTPDAVPLRIGQSALDHHNSSLLFIDDDTPCYGRVTGPDRVGRQKLASLLVSALTPRSAPTGAHFMVRE
jgi:hypothetical protein